MPGPRAVRQLCLSCSSPLPSSCFPKEVSFFYWKELQEKRKKSTLVKTAQWKARRGKRAGDECPSNLMALKPHSISSLPPLPTKLAPKRMGVLSKQAPELRRCESNKNKGSSQAMTAAINTVPISGEMVLI